MRTYRIRVDGKVYEMDITLLGEEVCAETESGITLGERLPYDLKTGKEQPDKKTEK